MDLHGEKALTRARVLLAAFGLALGGWGLKWGLPSRERLDLVMPPGLAGPAFGRILSDSWKAMHERLGANLMLNPEAWKSFSGVRNTPAGWTTPPEVLLNSYRSFHVRSAHEDEQTMLIILSRMRPWKFEFHHHMFTYGAVYLYSLGAWLALGWAAGLVSLHTSLEPYLADPAKMAGLYLAGRAFSLAGYVACSWMLLRLGRRVFDSTTGLLAGLLFLFSPGVVTQAHVMKNHTFWAFLALWTVDRSLTLLETGKKSDYALAGALSGLAVGAFLNAWPACLVVGAAGGIRVLLGKATAKEFGNGTLLAAAASVAAFLATNPFWLFSWDEALREMAVLKTVGALDLRHPFIFLWNPVRHGVTWPVLALGAAGAALAARRGLKEPGVSLLLIAVGLGLAATVTFGGVYDTRHMRYGLGWVSLSMLFAGHAAVFLLRSNTRFRPLLVGVVSLVFSNSFLSGATYSRNFALDAGKDSTHARSGAWISEHVPEGAVIGLLRLPQPSNAPYFRYGRNPMMFIERPFFAGLRPEELPGYLVVTVPDYDDRPFLEPNLGRYERVARFERDEPFPWISIERSATTANPIVEVYKLKS